MGFSFHVIGMVAVMLAVLGHYRMKNNRPLVVNRDRNGYADSPYGGEFPTECPCGCGLMWAADTPYPPHYTSPPYVTGQGDQSRGDP